MVCCVAWKDEILSRRGKSFLKRHCIYFRFLGGREKALVALQKSYEVVLVERDSDTQLALKGYFNSEKTARLHR